MQKGHAGMGNRVFTFISAVAYSKMTGRKLFVDWRDGMYAPKGVDAFSLFFDSPAVSPLSELRNSESVAPAVWKGRLGEPIDSLLLDDFRVRRKWMSSEPRRQKYSIDIGDAGCAEDIAVFFDYSLRFDGLEKNRRLFLKEWPADAPKAFAKHILKESLFLKPDLAEEISLIRKLHFSSPMIGVHVRHTDNLPFDYLRSAPFLRKYEREIARLSLKNPAARIFLCTDSRKVELHFKKLYPGIFVLEKDYPEDSGQPIHLWRDCPDSERMARAALLDLYLLSGCDFLICSAGSSFSRLAECLPGSRVGYVVGVRSFRLIPFLLDINRGIRDFLSEADRRFGLAGQWLRDHFPRIYFFLRPKSK